jgi:hypothetical protein
MMNDECLLLSKIVGLIGYSGGDANEKEEQLNSETTTNNSSRILCRKLLYPSFSLSRHENDISDSSSGLNSTSSPSKEEAQTKASSWMSRQIIQHDATEPQLREEVSFRILEATLDSFDQLVDARIRQYSKILRNHYLSLLLNDDDDDDDDKGRAKVVEYKLRTLLEYGTNISFGSISSRFTVLDSTDATTTTTTTDNSTIVLPVMLTVEINSLQFQQPTSSSRSSNNNNHRHTSNNKLTFQAPGWIKG